MSHWLWWHFQKQECDGSASINIRWSPWPPYCHNTPIPAVFLVHSTPVHSRSLIWQRRNEDTPNLRFEATWLSLFYSPFSQFLFFRYLAFPPGHRFSYLKNRGINLMCIHRVTSGCSVVDSWSIQSLKEQHVYSTLEHSVTAPSGNCTDAEAVEPNLLKFQKK